MSAGTLQETITVRRLDQVDDRQIRQLAEVLIDCVEGGASVSFMQPLSLPKAMAYWRRMADGVARAERVLLVAEDAGVIVGSAQLVLEMPENQPHRADVAKMLVHRRARRRGVGAALLAAIETAARAAGRLLLVLDTADASAARLYVRMGWQRVGVVPGFALWPAGGACDTTFFYRALDA